jgi:cytoskeletal protein CcmA (bactofilin family)
MFSRNADRPAPPGTAPVPGVRDVSPPPQPYNPQAHAEITVVARTDQVEGTLRVADLLRVLGSVEGRIETTTLIVEEGARVAADVVADEVVIAGEYNGTLTCRQRLEVRPTGRVAGTIETFRLMLHEGAAVDGEMKMLKQPGLAEAEAIRAGGVRGAADPGLRAPAAPTPAPAPLSPGNEPIG